MPAPVHGPIPRYMVYVGSALYNDGCVQDIKVETRMNQIGVASITLNLTHSTLLVDGGNVLVCDHVNNLPVSGKVMVRDEVIRYNARTELNSLEIFQQEYQNWLADPQGYTPSSTQFELTGLTRGDEGTPQGTHPAGSKVFIHPIPQEGDDVRIYYGGRFLLSGVISNVEREEETSAVNLEVVEVSTRIRDIQVTSKTLHTEKRTGELLEMLIPPGWGSDVEYGIKMNYRMEIGNNLMHLANLCVISGFDWWVTTDDSNPENLVHTIHCRSERGSSIPKATWSARLKALNLKRSDSKDHIYNSVTAIGSSAEMQGSSTTLNANTIRITSLVTTESVLAENIGPTDLSIVLLNATDYVVGDSIQIGDEKLTISSKNGNALGVTRGQNSTVAESHHVGDPVLMITFLSVLSSSDLDKSQGYPQYVWIGSEKIRVTGIYGNRLQALTRGVDDTIPYAHRAGTLVLSADGSNEDPEEVSSIGLYGIRAMRQSVIGAADMDGLDKYAGAVLLELKELLPGGTLRVPLSAFPSNMVIGDTFTLQEYGVTGTSDHRITGLTWDKSGTVTVSYGHPEDWILADFADAAKAMQLATQKTPPAAQGAVIQTSPDGKMVQVQGADGPIWVRVQL